MQTSRLEGSLRLMRSNWTGPVNIGNDEMVSINQLAETVMKVAGKTVSIRHIPGPIGVRGRDSDIVSSSKSSTERPTIR